MNSKLFFIHARRCLLNRKIILQNPSVEDKDKIDAPKAQIIYPPAPFEITVVPCYNDMLIMFACPEGQFLPSLNENWTGNVTVTKKVLKSASQFFFYFYQFHNYQRQCVFELGIYWATFKRNIY